jgi:ornithine cyclodeaminase
MFYDKVRAISNVKVMVHNDVRYCLGSAKIISFATTASTPHITTKSVLPNDSIVLHVSLRDIGPDIIKSSINVVDDIEHVNRENTSIHLAAKKYGSTDFITASLGDLLLGNKKLPNDSRPTIFSPFGLGVLDMQLARFVYEQAAKKGVGILIKDFIPPSWHEKPY